MFVQMISSKPEELFVAKLGMVGYQSSWARVLHEKIGLLCSRSESQFEGSDNQNSTFYYFFWTADLFATKYILIIIIQTVCEKVWLLCSRSRSQWKCKVFNICPDDSSEQLNAFFTFIFYNCIVPMGFLSWEIWVPFPGESQLQQSCATLSRVHAGCFSVSMICWTLIWTTWSVNVCTDVNARDCAQGWQTLWESLHQKLTLGKIPCHTGESNLCQWHTNLMLYQLTYIPTPV